MIISKCCKESVHVCDGQENGSYYVCNACSLPCVTLSSLSFGHAEDEEVNFYHGRKNDTRHEGQGQKFIA